MSVSIASTEPKRRGRPPKVKTEAVLKPEPKVVLREAKQQVKETKAKQKKLVTPTQETAIEHLVGLQRDRCFAIVSQSRCDRSMEQFIARTIGYRHTQVKDTEENKTDNKAARTKLMAEAKRIRKEVEEATKASPAKNLPKQITKRAQNMIKASAIARAAWDEQRDLVESEMRRLAQTLPVWEFVKSVRGISELGLAAIIGETDDLSNYANPARVWKRCGLAVIEGQRQRKCTDKDEALKHGYSPKRRAQIWAFLSDTMFRSQWLGGTKRARTTLQKMPKAVAYCQEAGIDLAKAKDEELEAVADKFDVAIEGAPQGPYGEIYQHRKQATMLRDWTKGHQDRDARRIMSKAFLVDLWRIWHGQLPRGSKIEDIRLAA